MTLSTAAADEIRFDDASAYERYMGVWSQIAATSFLQWLAAPSAMRWLDIGCGSGAFAEMVLQQCAPVSVDGIDPSEPQIEFARRRVGQRPATFRCGDAMSLPFPDDSFDLAVMPLVIFFVPHPPTGVAEMARVVRSGGIVAAYAWDMPGGGFPYDALWNEMRAAGATVPVSVSPEASRIEVLAELWTGAGLVDVETRELNVQRTFASFDDYWTTILGGPSVGPALRKMPPETLAQLQSRMRERLTAAPDGTITLTARANAAKGRVP